MLQSVSLNNLGRGWTQCKPLVYLNLKTCFRRQFFELELLLMRPFPEMDMCPPSLIIEKNKHGPDEPIHGPAEPNQGCRRQIYGHLCQICARPRPCCPPCRHTKELARLAAVASHRRHCIARATVASCVPMSLPHVVRATFLVVYPS